MFFFVFTLWVKIHLVDTEVTLLPLYGMQVCLGYLLHLKSLQKNTHFLHTPGSHVKLTTASLITALQNIQVYMYM